MACVYNVPMALDATQSHTEGLDPHFAMIRNNAHIEKVKKCAIGPMPPAQFLDEFLPVPAGDRTGMLSPKGAFKAVPRSAENPEDIYQPLWAALNKKTKYKARCPGFVFVDTLSRSIRPLRLGYTKPHISCFTTENAEVVCRADKASRVELGYAELFISVQKDPSLDFFVDPPAGLSEDALHAHNFCHPFVEREEAKYDRIDRAFGLHLGFVAELFARQYRLFVFTVTLSGSLARLFRWDRSGCVVTQAFDIRENPETLLEFFWRFSQVTYLERGHDSSVSVASPAEEALFRDVVEPYVRCQLQVEGEGLEKALRAHYSPGQVAVMQVHSAKSSTSEGVRRIIVSRPVVSPLYLEGRATRGFWAVCSTAKTICFLKDTWRSRSMQELEGNVLSHLNELGIHNIPLFDAHGDVQDDAKLLQNTRLRCQRTLTARFMKAAWASRIEDARVYISKRQHYRLVTSTVGYGLRTIRGTRELLYAAYDVFIAMQDALAKDLRIHRDLSFGNIILVREPDRALRRGYLIDWEASDRIDEVGESLQDGRAGTWDFMSIRMLELKPGKHRFTDDMESLLYVVLYAGLMYLSHDASMQLLTTTINGFFRVMGMPSRDPVGGDGKIVNRVHRTYTAPIRFRSAAFQEWLDTVLNFHGPLPEDREKYKDMWNCAQLDAFWSQFLRTRELDEDDRQVHKLSMSGCYDLASPPTTHTPSTHPKHPRPSAASRPSKRARRGPSPTDPPRRSDRIRNQQHPRSSETSIGAYQLPPTRHSPRRAAKRISPT
ncbi:hypothetical protein C8Q77DRAFT_1060473 [Trametes polyzona]|nr:hypothetical protein C8Q77DRAFT_1060473 [Trametes polyzona]